MTELRSDGRYVAAGGRFLNPSDSTCTVTLKRRSIACELNAAYFRDGVNYVRGAEEKLAMPTLFDVTEWTERPEEMESIDE